MGACSLQAIERPFACPEIACVRRERAYIGVFAVSDTVGCFGIAGASGFRSEPWEAFAQWVRQCHDDCGMVCGDGNLRNFLWDDLENRCVGLDFEEYRRGELPEAGANLVAYLMEYDPADSPVKRQAASILRSELGVSDSSIHAIRQELRLRRSIKAAGANGTSAQRGAGLRRMSITGDFGKVSE